MPLAAISWLAGLAVLLVAYSIVTLESLGSEATLDFFGRWVYDAVVLGAAAAVLLRGIRMEAERAAWLSIGIGLALWALGQTYYSVVLYYAYPAPFPSPADVLFLAFYPAAFLGIVLLLRGRSNRDSFAWMDSLIGALAVAAIAGAYVVWTYVVAPEREQIKTLQVETDSLQRIVDAAKADLAQGTVEDLRRAVATYSASLELARRLVPERNEVPALIDDISTRSKIREITLGTMQPLTPEAGSPFDTHRFRLEVFGHFDQIGEFLSAEVHSGECAEDDSETRKTPL